MLSDKVIKVYEDRFKDPKFKNYRFIFKSVIGEYTQLSKIRLYYKIRNIRTGERAEFTQAGTRYISGLGPNEFLNLFKRNKTIMLGGYEIELVELREKKISITVERAKEKIKELKEVISELEAFIQEKENKEVKDD